MKSGSPPRSPCSRSPRRQRAGRDDADRHRPRLGARGRDEPVGCVRLRAARLGVQADPLPLLPRHGHEDGRRAKGPRAPRSGREGRDDRLQDTDHGERRTTVQTASPGGYYGIGPRLAVPVAHRAGVRPFARGFADFSCPRAPLTLGGRPYRGNLVVRRSGKTLSVVTRSSSTIRARRRPVGVPAHWPMAELEAQAVAARS